MKALLSNWQVSGVTKLLSGTAVNPNCQNTTTRGIQYSMPSYTNLITAVNNSITARCNLTGEPINAGKRVDVDPSNPDPLTARYFNLAAFAMPTPLSATVGDFGNAPLGLLRNPTVSEWDVTLERRIPFGRRGVRLLLQTYNLFNQVEWTTLNAALTYNGTNNVQSSTTAGQYGTVINPRQIGLSVRFDFYSSGAAGPRRPRPTPAVECGIRDDVNFATRLRRADCGRRRRNPLRAERRVRARLRLDDGAGDRRSDQEEHRRRLEHRRRRYVQDRRSLHGRHRRGDDVHGDAGGAPEGRAGWRELRHHRRADLLFEGGPEHARGTRIRRGGAGAASRPVEAQVQAPARLRHPQARAGRAQAPRRRCRPHPRCHSQSCHRRSHLRPRRLQPHRRRRIPSTQARTTSSRNTNWSCFA